MSVYWLGYGTDLTINQKIMTARATVGRTTGKYYWEIYINSVSANLVGIVNSSASLTASVFADTSCRWYYFNAEKTPPRNNYGSEFGIGDTIGVFLDLDDGKLEFFKNGVSQGVAFTNLSTLGEVFPAISTGSSGSIQNITANFGASAFSYPPKNLPSGTMSYDENQVLTVRNKTLILHGGYKKYQGIKEMKSLIPTLTSDTSASDVGNVITVSTHSTSGYLAFNKVNTNTTGLDAWGTNIKGTVGFNFNEPKYVRSYVIKVINNNTYAPINWIFEGSDDLINWKPLDIVNGFSWGSNLSTQRVLKEHKGYKAYRISVNGNNGAVNGNVLIGELEFLGYDSKPIFEQWATVSQSTPTQEQFLLEGMDDLSLLDRKVTTLKPLQMTDKSEILSGEAGKAFSRTIDLKKYIDIRNIKVEVE